MVDVMSRELNTDLKYVRKRRPLLTLYSTAVTRAPCSLVSGCSFWFYWVKLRKCLLCTVWVLTHLQNKKMVSKFNVALVHFVISLNYFSFSFFFFKEPVSCLEFTLVVTKFGHKMSVNALFLDSLLLSPCHGHRTIYRKVTVQTGYIGAGNSSGYLYRWIGEQINTCYIMHVCAGVRLILSG